jgi:hypothetical protein
MKISLQDFIKIFKSDKVSENMVKVINQEAVTSKHHQDNASQIVKPPPHALRHPDLKSPTN